MANPKSKILPRILSTMVVVCMFYCIGEFAPMLGYDFSMFGVNIIGAGLGIIIVGVVCIANQRPLGSIGLIFELPRILRGILVGGSMAVLPIAFVFAVQVGLYSVFKIPSLAPSFVAPNFNGEASLIKLVLFAAGCGASSLMQELTFRGYVVRSMRPQYPFTDANIAQAGLSIALPLIAVAKNLICGGYAERSGVSLWIFLVIAVVFFAAYTFISSLKRGFVTRVTGDIWPSFFGNFFFQFLGGGLFVQSMILTSYSSMIRLFAAETISMTVAYIYYHRQYVRNKKRKEEHEKKLAQRLEAMRLEELSRGADPNVEDLSQKSVKEIMEQHNKRILDSIGAHSKPVQPQNDDSIVNLKEVEFNENVNP
ncbi:MAG: hypothetical protein IJZ57_10840 [Clostridia bacterium]|nr:hypothetical protein [Clostridia bacterium]